MLFYLSKRQQLQEFQNTHNIIYYQYKCKIYIELIAKTNYIINAIDNYLFKFEI